MKIYLNVFKKTEMGHTYYDVDNSQTKGVKYLSKEDIVAKVSELNGITASEVYSNFSTLVNQKYVENTAKYIKKKIIRDLAFSISNIVHNVPMVVEQPNVQYLKNNIRIKLNYEQDVYNSQYKESKWIQNYLNGIKTTKGLPFEDGDKELVDYLENVILGLKDIQLIVSDANKKEHQFNVSYYKEYKPKKRIMKKINNDELIKSLNKFC